MKKVLVLAAVLALSACSKLSTENYNKLEMGMNMDEVKAIIGSPDNCSETLGVKSCIWGKEDGTYIKVSFAGDNAATFSNNGLK